MRRQYAGLGRQILDRAFERAGKTLTDDKLKGALPRLARSSIDDVLAAVGRGEMFSGDVVKAVFPDFKEERRAPPPEANPSGWLSLAKGWSIKIKLPRKDSGGESGIGVGCAPTARAFSVAASSSLIPSAVVVAWVG